MSRSNSYSNAHTLARDEIENLCAELAADADEETRIQAGVLRDMALECLEARMARIAAPREAPTGIASRETPSAPAVAAPSGPSESPWQEVNREHWFDSARDGDGWFVFGPMYTYCCVSDRYYRFKLPDLPSPATHGSHS